MPKFMKALFFNLIFLLSASSMIEAQETSSSFLFLADYEGNSAIYRMQADGTEIEKFIDIPPVEEGGEITSASLSPDGTKLAVSSNKVRSGGYPTDEIFILDLTTSLVTALTNDERNNTLPEWSPDSRHIVYLTGIGVDGFDTVYVADTSSLVKQILTTSASLTSLMYNDFGATIRDIDWSPDGSKLIMSIQTGLPDVLNALIVLNADGTNIHQITPNEMDAGPKVSWGADLNLIYSACLIANYGEICQVNLQTLQISQVTNLTEYAHATGNPYVTDMDISQNGDIVFTYGIVNRSIYRFNLATNSIEVLNTPNFDFYFMAMAELPEDFAIVSNELEAQETSNRLLFLADYEGNSAIYRMQADGTEIEKFIDIPPVEEGGEITSASLSPDGTKLAVSSRKERELYLFSDEIFIFDIPTETIIAVTNDKKNNTLPRWSPDSQHLAYLTGNGINGYNEITIFDINFQNRQIVATTSSLTTVVLAPIPNEDRNPILQEFDWSPDGNRLVISAQIGAPDVYNFLIVVNTDGTNAQQLTPPEIQLGPNIAWGADPNFIY